ncbi:MAG TPA: outer membrane beta-barrel protein [Burkholderiales bacterium]|nr:outer membrane beta-barrel protein [Burkholderiales bacterium]
MKIKKHLVRSVIALSGLGFAGQALAQGYVGGSVGQTDFDSEITSGLITSGSVDTKDTAFKLFGGYMFNQNFGLEAAYVDLGEASYSGTFGGSPVTGGKVEASGFNISGLGSFPVTPTFSVFGKLGLFIWEAEASDTTGGVPFSQKNDGTDLSFGIGVSYDFTRNLSARAEWERLTLDEVDADVLSIGFAYKF